MRRINVLLFLVLFFSNIESMFAKEGNSHIELDVLLKEDKSSILLHVKLTNKGKIPFPTYSGFLPWVNYDVFQILLIPFTNTSGNILFDNNIKQILTIADPISSLKFIFPKKTIEGYIVLNERFPNKEIELFKRKNVLICWGYPLFRYGEINSIWYQGYIVSQIQETEKLLISETLDDIFNKKCSTNLVHIEAR